MRELLPFRFAILLSASLLFVSSSNCFAENQANSLSEAEQKTGWKLLFDGKSTAGWRNYKADSVSDGWAIKDGALVRLPSEKGHKSRAGDLITEKQYEAFDLSLEYKISKEGNSGVMFHVLETSDRPWHTGPEIQIFDNGGKPEGAGQMAGWLYQLYKPVVPSWQIPEGQPTPPPIDTTRPAGEWNQMYIHISPKQSEIFINGYSYYRFKKGSKDWNKRVASSKFSKQANFGKPTKGHIVLQDHGNEVAFRNIKIRELNDDKLFEPTDGEMDLKSVVAFPNLNWQDWSPISEKGKQQEFRPIVITHANDSSNRLFVASQKGRIYHFDNNPDVENSTLFLDITDRAMDYKSRGANEGGLIGFAMHPNFKSNGEFFVYYTAKEPAHASVISRFRVSKTNPNVADPASEETILKLNQPFANHNGGTIEFGKDGMLYIAFGDGGSGNDPHKNGQNLKNFFGTILRVDVDNPSDGKPYSVPKDNPFVGNSNALPEIFAYGFRNPWRFSIDRETGVIWESDVGQGLFEEINIVESGGNYGWSKREGAHVFGPDGLPQNDKMIDPVWEYDHGVGKSITGGNVYRGKKLPSLQGAYLYADYVTGRIWALKHADCDKTKTTNYAIPTDKMPVLTFGEDEQGEVYFSTVRPDGRGIHKFVPKSEK